MAREGYRDSGVEWIGEIPEGWDINTLKRHTQFNKGTKIESSVSGDYPILTAQYLRGNSEPTEFTNNEKNLCEDGEILVLWDGAGAGDVFISKQGILGSTMGRITLNSDFLTKEYLLAILLSSKDKIVNSQITTIPHVSGELIRNLPIPLPPLPEQVRIAEYLDFETGKIDALVSELTEFSKTLKARTKSLIAECVTKGLPSGRQGRPMRDSGVEWLGEVPEEWEVPQIGKVTGIINGGTPDSANPIYWDGDIPWVTPADMDGTHFERLKKGRRSITEAGLKDFNGVLVPKGSVILSKRAPIGLVALAGEKIATNQGCCTLVCDSKLNSKYMYYYLTSHTDYMNSLGKGTTFLEISNASLKGMRAPLPPLSEQLAIADYLDSEVAKSDALIASVASLIEDLRVYRKALISEVVTGRRRV